MLTHINLTSSLEMNHAPIPKSSLFLPTTQDFQEVYPCSIPFYHIYGLSYVLFSKLSLGGKLVTLPRFHPEAYLSTLAVYKATWLVVVPPIFQFLTNDDRCTTKHLSHVRMILNGAAAVGSGLVNRFIETKLVYNDDFIQELIN